MSHACPLLVLVFCNNKKLTISVQLINRLHKLILDDLGVKSVAICIGGSMGGMQVLEWSFFGPDYIKAIVPIATSAKHSAWCISWGEAQRQSIYSDPNYLDGYYTADAVSLYIVIFCGRTS